MLLNLLFSLLILVVIAGIVYMIVDAIWPGDMRFKRIALAILGLIFLVYLLQVFGFLGAGSPRLFR